MDGVPQHGIPQSQVFMKLGSIQLFLPPPPKVPVSPRQGEIELAGVSFGRTLREDGRSEDHLCTDSIWNGNIPCIHAACRDAAAM